MQRNKWTFDYTYKYEFPGDKVEEGECCTSALMSELRDEMDMTVYITEADYVATVTHQYPDFEITMRCHLCKPETEKFARKNIVFAVNIKKLNY